MAQTLKLRTDSAGDIDRAAQIIRDGGTVAFPTETVYGLGANALDGTAVARIFEAKQRPSWDPLIVHIADASQLPELTQLDSETALRVNRLSRAFWPGPLTLLLPKRSIVPDAVTAGRALVGLRMPSLPTAQKLLRSAGVPIAAPSANTFGHTSPTTAAHVLADLDGRIDAVIDGGATAIGLESTVIDPTQTPIMLYRPGAVTPEAITRLTGNQVKIFQPSDESRTTHLQELPSPGVGIRHYAPRAKVNLTEGSERALSLAVAGTEKVGVLLPLGWCVGPHAVVQEWGRWDNPQELALNLFAGLRELDDRGVEQIFCPLPPPGGLNNAIRDRLLKAARPA